MRHCVYSYAASCAAGRTSIWTMQVEQSGASRRELTIEVRPPTRLVMEARDLIEVWMRPSLACEWSGTDGSERDR